LSNRNKVETFEKLERKLIFMKTNWCE